MPNARYSVLSICTLCLFILFTGTPSKCWSASIPMLPPMQSTNLNVPCIGSQGNKFLSWDGTNAIKCNYGITTDGAGRTNLSRDNAAECCSSSNYTLSLAENTISTGNAASIQFHNAGRHEGFLRLAPDGVRRFQMADNQGSTMGLQMTGALQVDGANASYIQGALGVGTTTPVSRLDVAGGIKVANDAASCTAEKAGTIRWTGAAMQYCNGAAWTPFGITVTNEAACGSGTLLQWDSATKTATCRPIFAATNCTRHTTYTAGEQNVFYCPTGTRVMSGSCWRAERTGGSENWMGGLFIGDTVALDTNSYACRIEGANGVYVNVSCCQ